jgi:hypothetical protein
MPMTKGRMIAQFFIFTLVFLPLNYLCNELYYQLITSKTDIAGVDRDFREWAQDIDILVLGDSEPRTSVHPDILENSYIYAFPGESYVQTYYKLKYFLEKEELDFKLIILQIDLQSFSSFKTDRIGDHGFWKRYIDYIELGRMKGDLLTYLSYRLEGEFAYLGGIDATLEYINSYPLKLKTERGFLAWKSAITEHNENEIRQLAKKRAIYHFAGCDYLDKDLLAYFLRILDLCHKHNIPVVLVRYPITQWYYAEAAALIPVDHLYEEVYASLDDHGYGEIPIFDYHDRYWDHPEFFVDPNHMNAIGARQFTIVLKDDLAGLNLLP